MPPHNPSVPAGPSIPAGPSTGARRISVFGVTFALPMIIWQLVFFVFPLLFLIALSFWVVKNYRMTPAFDSVNWIKMFGKGYFWDAYQRTFVLALISTALTSLVAFPCAFALAFKVSPTIRRWAIFLLIIPFFTSYLVRVYSWQLFLGSQGIINAMIGYLGLGPWPMLNNAFGTLVGYMTLCLPLVIVLQLLSLSNVDKRLIEAAWNLGCSRFKTLYKVIIPSAKTGLIIAATFCFILSFGDFVSPYYLGGSKPPTLSILIIDTTKSGQQWPRAAVVAIVMIVTLLVFAFTAVTLAYRKPKRRRITKAHDERGLQTS